LARKAGSRSIGTNAKGSKGTSYFDYYTQGKREAM
jgi:hypothetical protein